MNVLKVDAEKALRADAFLVNWTDSQLRLRGRLPPHAVRNNGAVL